MSSVWFEDMEVSRPWHLHARQKEDTFDASRFVFKTGIVASDVVEQKD